MISLLIKKIFYIFLFYASFIVCSPIFSPPFRIIDSIHTNIFIIQDSLGNHFILKYHLNNPQRAIYDTLGAYVGQFIDININTVEIFSQKNLIEFFTEMNNNELSHLDTIITLHSYVPGMAITTIKNMHEEICIKGGLYKIRNLKSIAKYISLCNIVAFDIFIDNSDRHNKNLFFDQNTNQFYIIDMDHSFASFHAFLTKSHDHEFETLATKAYRFLQTVDALQLSLQEVRALRLVQITLQLLVNLFSPEKIFAQWIKIAHKAHIMYSAAEQEKIMKYLIYNNQEINRLLILLELTLCNTSFYDFVLSQ